MHLLPQGQPSQEKRAGAGAAVVRSRFTKCRLPVALVRVIPLVRSGWRCSFHVHRAPLRLLVCFTERLRFVVVRSVFVLDNAIVKHGVYKVKHKICILCDL